MHLRVASWTASAVLAGLLVACTGEVEPASGQDPATDPQAGPGGPGAAGTGPSTTEAPGGTATLRRLTPFEYHNTARDLLGASGTALLRGFPADGRTEGFDNNATTLGVAPSQLEVFAAAAEQLAAQLVVPGSAALARFVQCGGITEPTCLSSTIEAFASRAFRRPVTPEELSRLGKLAKVAADQGATPAEQLELAVRGVLTSAAFLFRVELVPPGAGTQRYAVSSHELASRLSYFLWSSLPDDALWGLALQGELSSPAIVAREVGRMLADPKAAALTDNFAQQWLGLTRLAEHAVDLQQFPEYDAALASSMLSETSRLFSHVLSAARPASELVSADYGFIDAKLGAFYGLASAGDGTAPVALAGAPRRGLTGQASILTLTSYPNRTSVVRRGVWVLENLLCTSPPPPPEGVDTQAGQELLGTLRQRMQQHRADPTCAGCHNLMDPIGFGLENFDAIGRYRTTENGEPIDPSGELSAGRSFNGPSELPAVLASDERLASCIGKKLMTYAWGRSLTPTDEAVVAQLEASVGPAPTLRALIEAVAESSYFATQQVTP